ncbi:hypothetical protein CC86DRAFT_431044 [Ophiobolus disseminans]|uniref:DUF7730 domain-containing protein n=1 Tax=Ophiobolus disseminans TaxID=1469910 RepID=A0A6A7ADG3_9PLEO|nr:hypothetical protein CC86DRAFT_431044 [Ophiobolus disseminans]
MCIPTFRQEPQELPVWGDAFGTQYIAGGKPVGPTPPLRDTPRILFVPAQGGSKDAANWNPTATETARDISAQNAVSSPLLRLPAEIRNRIWAYASTSDGVIELRPCKPAPFTEVQPATENGIITMEDLDMTEEPPTFPLQLTCRQIAQESSLHPFTENTFHCTNAWDLCLILRRMTLVQRTTIKTFKIRYSTAENILWSKPHACKSSSNAFVQLTGLERLIIAAPNKFIAKYAQAQMKKDFEAWIDGVLEVVVVEVEGVQQKKETKKMGGVMLDTSSSKTLFETLEDSSTPTENYIRTGYYDEEPGWGWENLGA